MSELRQTVSDTGPLISLEKMRGGFGFIRRLFDSVIIPPAVLTEIAYGHETTSAYLREHEITGLIEVQAAPTQPDIPELERLHEGETQAIRLALELDLPLLIEERAGRRAAQEVGLRVSGVAGQIVKAFRHEHISEGEAKAKLHHLLGHRRINEKIYNRLLAALEERS